VASLKKLAGQTVWYGFSNIAARLLTYLLTPYFTYILATTGGQVEFGRYAFIYACIPVLNVLYTYGMETAFFRFSTDENKTRLYRTQLTMLLLTTLGFTILLYFFRAPLAAFINVPDQTTYVGWCAAIIGLDALAALPYARLRRENRPRKYAFTKVAGILVYVGSIVFLFSVAGRWAGDPQSAFGEWYHRHWGLGFILFANILQSVVTLFLLLGEFADYRPMIDPRIAKKVLRYGFPVLIAGFAGVINDTLDRVMFQKLYPVPEEVSLRMVGVYTAAVRLSVMISLVIQAFRMAAEPFFFSVSREQDAPQTYARVMKWFVIVLATMFLGIMLFLDVWKYFVGPAYREALGLVPVLLLGYICLGVYYNLTVWYKLTDKTIYGAWIMLTGSVVTVVFNWLFIPYWGYAACAWGTLLCYGTMMVLSYVWGQKHYPIPYPLKRMGGYLGAMLLLYLVQRGVNMATDVVLLRLLSGAGLTVVFLWMILKREKEELIHFPVIGKWIKTSGL
jgi:O-antigen/teichoic acid export membrane protein